MILLRLEEWKIVMNFIAELSSILKHFVSTLICCIGPNGDIRSPKRAATEYRSVLIERNSFTSPVKDRLISNLKQKLTPVLHAAFAR